MNAQIKNKIAPPSPTPSRNQGTTEIGNRKSGENESTNNNPVNFKDLLIRSNRETAEKRNAEANGDLSQAKNYQEFLSTLNKKTTQEGMPRNSLDKHDFLNLFITQIQNQDPLNPKDGTEMASQLAQFNSLEQMMNMNTSLEKLGEKADEGHNIQFVDYIGKDVQVSNGKVRLEAGALTEAEFKTNLPISRTTMSVRDSLGNIIASKDLGPRQAGTHTLEWNGINSDGETVPNGVYTVSLLGKGKGGSEIELPVSTRLKITGIDLKDKGSSFYTTLGKISYSDISEIGGQGFKKNASGQNEPAPGLETKSKTNNEQNIRSIQGQATNTIEPSEGFKKPPTRPKTSPSALGELLPKPSSQKPGVEAYKRQLNQPSKDATT